MRLAMRVLIIDDKIDQVETLVMVLQGYRFIASSALNIETAITITKEHKPDHVILDILIKKETGLKYYNWLRENKEYGNIKVTMVTGLNAIDAKEKYNIPDEIVILQ